MSTRSIAVKAEILDKYDEMADALSINRTQLIEDILSQHTEDPIVVMARKLRREIKYLIDCAVEYRDEINPDPASKQRLFNFYNARYANNGAARAEVLNKAAWLEGSLKSFLDRMATIENESKKALEQQRDLEQSMILKDIDDTILN